MKSTRALEVIIQAVEPVSICGLAVVAAVAVSAATAAAGAVVAAVSCATAPSGARIKASNPAKRMNGTTDFTRVRRAHNGSDMSGLQSYGFRFRRVLECFLVAVARADANDFGDGVDEDL